MSTDYHVECSCRDDVRTQESRHDDEARAAFGTLPQLRALAATGVWDLSDLRTEGSYGWPGLVGFLLSHDGPGHSLAIVSEYGGREAL